MLDKIDNAAEMHEKIADGVEKGTAFCEKAVNYLEKGCSTMDKFGQVFSKCADVIDTVAPWLGPIGIGLKVATSFVSLFVKSGMSQKEIGEENLRLNKLILEHVSEVLEEVKELKIFCKYGRDMKKFKATYNTYRDMIFDEGN